MGSGRIVSDLAFRWHGNSCPCIRESVAFSELQKSQFRHRLFPHRLLCDHYLRVFEEVEMSSNIEFVVCDGIFGLTFGLAGGEEEENGIVPKHKQSPLA